MNGSQPFNLSVHNQSSSQPDGVWIQYLTFHSLPPIIDVSALLGGWPITIGDRDSDNQLIMIRNNVATDRPWDGL